MYTDENYLWGLVSYYLAASVLLFCCWHFRKIIAWRYLRHLLLLLVAIFLLLPIKVTPELHYLAPAWFVSVFDGLTSAPEGFSRAGVPLLITYLVAAVLYIPVIAYFRKRSSKKANQ